MLSALALPLFALAFGSSAPVVAFSAGAALAILLLHRHQFAGGVEPRRAASLVQEHQCEQPPGFDLVGHQVDQQRGQPDGLGGQEERMPGGRGQTGRVPNVADVEPTPGVSP